jgi:hypothetical protein
VKVFAKGELDSATNLLGELSCQCWIERTTLRSRIERLEEIGAQQGGGEILGIMWIKFAEPERQGEVECSSVSGTTGSRRLEGGRSQESQYLKQRASVHFIPQ